MEDIIEALGYIKSDKPAPAEEKPACKIFKTSPVNEAAAASKKAFQTKAATEAVEPIEAAQAIEGIQNGSLEETAIASTILEAEKEGCQK